MFVDKTYYYFINTSLVLIAFFISFTFSVEYENKTDFYSNHQNNYTLIHSFFKDLISDEFDVNDKNANKTIGPTNQTLSDLSLNKTFNSNETNASIILNQLLREISEKQSNVSASESRTLSSWLGLDLNRFRRPQFKLKPFFSPPQPPPQPQNIHPYVAPPPPQVLPPLLSPPNSFPGPHDPEALFLPQNMFEESGIKYWLKFIENAGNDENIHSDEYNGRPTMTHDDSRMRRPTKYSSRPKPIDIGDKPNSDDDNDDNESEDESEENNENEDDMEEPTDEPKSSGSSHSKQKYDTTPRCDKFTSDICVDDFEYPEQAIVDEIYKRRDIFELMYSEVSGNVPLVDGIPRDVEESYNYDYYYNDNKDPQASGSGFGDEEKQLSPGKGSSVCPTEGEPKPKPGD
jgi:hypothetical protein